MKDNVLLEVKQLCKSFKTNNVLTGIDIEIKKGDVVAVIGPSGCGKSTFLRCLNLLETPTSGQILFHDEYVFNGLEHKNKISKDINTHRQKIGMVFQQFNLFPHLTVMNNITLAPVKLNKMTKEQAEAKVSRRVQFRALLFYLASFFTFILDFISASFFLSSSIFLIVEESVTTAPACFSSANF